MMKYTSAYELGDVAKQVLAQRLLGKALQQGIITDQEYWSATHSITRLGILEIPDELAEKLAAVQWNIAEEIKLPDGFYVLHTRDGQWYAWNSTDRIVFSRFSGPYSEEATARRWCQIAFETLLAMASGEEHRQQRERSEHVHQ
jgi:hypothetical protein